MSRPLSESTQEAYRFWLDRYLPWCAKRCLLPEKYGTLQAFLEALSRGDRDAGGGAMSNPPQNLPRIGMDFSKPEVTKLYEELSIGPGDRLEGVMRAIMTKESCERFSGAITRASHMLETCTPAVIMPGPDFICGLYAQTPPGYISVVISGREKGLLGAFLHDEISFCIEEGRAYFAEHAAPDEKPDIPTLVRLILEQEKPRISNSGVAGCLLDLPQSQLSMVPTMVKYGITPALMVLLTDDERSVARFIMPHALTMTAEILPTAGTA